MADDRILIPDAPGASGGSVQSYELAADKTCPGHQAGILLTSGQTFVARAATMLVQIDWGATVLGGSKCAVTFHCGKVTPNGSRVSLDSVNRLTFPISQGPQPGVTDYREYLFPIAIDPESTPGNVFGQIVLTGLTVGATYTWEMKWGFLAGAKTRAVGVVPIRIAVDDLGMRGICTNQAGASVSLFTIGTWQFWQSAPGVFEASGAFPAGYEPTGYAAWAMVTTATVASPTIGTFPFGASFGSLSTGRRFLIGCAGDNKLYLLNAQTGAVLSSLGVAFAADPYDLQFFPGTNPTQAVVATDDSNLRIMNVSDAGIAQASAIAVGVAGRACAASFITGSTVGLWHGSRGVNPIRLRLYNVAGTIQNGASGIILEAALGDVRRIRRISSGPNIDTVLVATSRGKVYHVSRDGLTILGTWTHPNGVVDLADIAVGPNGVLCYVIDAVAGASELHYFWLPNTVGGPAYLHFDSSGIGAVTGLCIACTGTEDVLYGTSQNRVLNLPGGGGYCRPVGLPIGGEHLRVAFIEP